MSWLWDDETCTVRFIQAPAAVKTYLCPGCHREIPPGTFHLVAVPGEDPDLRRHWHKGCWEKRRRPKDR
jgi:hypothetical protein